jgi:hypothetical protein
MVLSMKQHRIARKEASASGVKGIAPLGKDLILRKY